MDPTSKGSVTEGGVKTRPTVVVTPVPGALEMEFMYAFSKDPNESEPTFTTLSMSDVMTGASGVKVTEYLSSGGPKTSTQSKGKSSAMIRSAPGAMRAAQNVLSNIGRPMGKGSVPPLPAFTSTSRHASGDEPMGMYVVPPMASARPGTLGATESMKESFEEALKTPEGEGSTVEMLQDELSMPSWFSLMQSELSYHDGEEEYSNPCLGLVVANAEISSSLGSETFGDEREFFFLVSPLVSTSQSVSSLGALYTYKPDPEKKITEYARFLNSPWIPIAAGSLYTNPPLQAPEQVTNVACEGRVVFRTEHLVKALEYYESHGPSMKAFADIIRAKYPAEGVSSTRCVMRVPVGFWEGDTIMHTMAKLCICARVPLIPPSIGLMTTPGYKEMMFTRWGRVV